MTQLFPDVNVYYDDDPIIPLLSINHDATTEQDPSTAPKQTIDDFVRSRLSTSTQGTLLKKKQKYAWLLCCSSIFLMDLEAQIVWASSDQSLIPLISLLASKFQNFDQEQSSKQRIIDLSTAHGHVNFS